MVDVPIRILKRDGDARWVSPGPQCIPKGKPELLAAEESSAEFSSLVTSLQVIWQLLLSTAYQMLTRVSLEPNRNLAHFAILVSCLVT